MTTNQLTTTDNTQLQQDINSIKQFIDKMFGFMNGEIDLNEAEQLRIKRYLVTLFNALDGSFKYNFVSEYEYHLFACSIEDCFFSVISSLKWLNDKVYED